MNKKQKQLIETYFRKREIVVNYKNTSLTEVENIFLIGQGKKPIIVRIEDWVLKRIEKEPNFIKNLDIDNLSSRNIGDILTTQPLVIDYLNSVIDKVESEDITRIILNSPEFIKKFDISKIDGPEIPSVIIKYPKLINYLDLNKMSGFGVSYVLIEKPNYIKKLGGVTHKMLGYFVMTVLKHQPTLVDFLDIKKMDGDKISNLLTSQPTLIDKLNPILDRLTNSNVMNILVSHPNLIKKINVKNLDEEYITAILIRQPILIDQLDIGILDGYFIDEILTFQPQLRPKFEERGLI